MKAQYCDRQLGAFLSRARDVTMATRKIRQPCVTCDDHVTIEQLIAFHHVPHRGCQIIQDERTKRRNFKVEENVRKRQI